VEESVEVLRRIAAALGAAHARGIVHRDVKPSNVFLPGRAPALAKLIDFGIARAPGSAGTSAGVLVGSAGYMAPEQVAGRVVDRRADQFALCAVLRDALRQARVQEGQVGSDNGVHHGRRAVVVVRALS
jgi:serine/threonine protein kinase